jgi:nickel transport protein
MAAAIERAVARQVRPLREDALAAREAVQFRDVLGGIGYILGLAGLGLWWRCRRSQAGR